MEKVTQALVKEIDRMQIEAQQQAQRGDWEKHRDTVNYIFGLKSALQIISSSEH